MQPLHPSSHRTGMASHALASIAFGASLGLQWTELLSGRDEWRAAATALLWLGLTASLAASAVAVLQLMRNRRAVIEIDLTALMGNAGIWLLFAAAAWAMTLIPAQAPRDALPCLLCTFAVAFALTRWAQGLREAQNLNRMALPYTPR